jgi:aminopeptidase YwaD
MNVTAALNTAAEAARQPAGWLDVAAADAQLIADFDQLCAFGGRMAGNGGDEAALAWAAERLAPLGGTLRRLEVPYAGWAPDRATLQLPGAASPLACRALLRSASTAPGGLHAEVVDVGQGRAEDFDAVGERLRGRIALVRHEYPFSAQHLHRRRKYDMAMARGAAAFLIANPIPQHGLLSGSSGRPPGGAGIPAAYIDHEASVQLAALPAGALVHLVIEGHERENTMAGVLVYDLPGERPERVVLSAHMDGHDLGCSALDNATGVAVVLATVRALAPRIGRGTNSLRVCFFSAEEWALAGSAGYLKGLPDDERESLKLNINLDTVAGDDQLTALTSGFDGLTPWVQTAGDLSGQPIGVHVPLMPNSDHANFAAAGVPALRLLAGFERPQSRVRHILSSHDLPGIVEPAELRQAVRASCALTALGLAAAPEALAAMATKA